MGVMANRQKIEHPEEGVATCWSCKGPVARSALFCATCGIIQPPHAADHFERLGLQRGFEIGEDELQKRYFDLQARLHPDRFASRTVAERAASLAQATALNEAYQTLRDPLPRAEYLLRLSGIDALGETSGTLNDPELLMESLERREALADAGSPEDISRIAAQTQKDAETCVAALRVAFATGDLNEAKRLAIRLQYLSKLGDEARLRLARKGS